MNASKIEANKTYQITVGRNTTEVRVIAVERRVNGQIVFDCMNVKTNKRITVSDAKRFLKEVKPVNPPNAKPGATKVANEDANRRESIAKTLAEAGAEPQHVKAAKVAMAAQAADVKGKGGKKKGTLSGLDAAAQVLEESTVPLNVKQITERAIAIGWAPEGKTPSATLAAALVREIAKKGEASRFAKVAAGQFARK